MNKKKIFKKLEAFEPKSMRNFLPIVWKSAKKDIVKDIEGKKYIDFTSTIFVQNFGHSNKKVKKYIKKQLDKNLLHSYTFAHKGRVKLLEKLTKLTGFKKAFLLSSGTESTEAAVKLMRMFGKSRGVRKIVSFEGSMHGRTMAASIMKNDLEYDHKDFIRLPYPTKESDFLKDIGDLSEIAGVIIETYQGWSAKFMPLEYVKKLAEICKKNNILLCFDEIQAGLYRCGTLFGYYLYEVKPDLICVGKALGGGLPLSAVLGSKQIMDIPNIGDMSSTHSANPLCCAAGLAIIDEIENLDIYKLKNKINLFKMRLELIKNKFSKLIKEFVCHGMVGSLIFNDKQIASEICLKCLNKGLLLVHTGRESIKFGPPIVIKNKNINKGFDILEEVLNEYN